MKLRKYTEKNELPDFNRLTKSIKHESAIAFKGRKDFMERVLPRRRRGGVSIHTPTRHNAEMQFAESYNELAFIHHCEVDSEILYLEMQPVSIRYLDGSKERRYTPDALVLYRYDPEPVLYEIKHADLVSEKFLAQFEAFQQRMKTENGVTLTLFTSAEMGSSIVKENTSMLIRHLWHHWDIRRLEQYWLEAPEIGTFGDYIEVSMSLGMTSSIVNYLLAHRFLHLDLTTRITVQSIVSKQNIFEQQEVDYGYAS
jgi:hypothetical protein